MKFKDLTPGARVRIIESHPSGYGDRVGRIIAVEVTVDIGEPLLIRNRWRKCQRIHCLQVGKKSRYKTKALLP